MQYLRARARIVGLAAICMSMFSCSERPPQKEPDGTHSFDSSYRAAYFEDTARLTRLAFAYPVADSMLKKYAVENHLPGLAYGIVVDGQLVHTGSFGYADIDKKVPVTSSTMFRIASMSKSVTALAILKLRDAGKLSLDEPASAYVPELKNQKYVSADAPVITIRHLLTHGAGFPEDNPWGDRQLADTDSELSALLKQKISFSNSPGVAYEYSNLGFALLGKIVSVVSGKPYQQYIREEIFRPLGMEVSGYEYNEIPAEQLAHGYRWLNEKWNEEELLHDTPDGSWGAMGGLISSVEEFSKYMALHLSAWPASNNRDSAVVNRSSVREMHHPWRFNGMNLQYRYADGRLCPVATAYCYGLAWLQDCEQKTVISHSGGLPGFGSHWGIMPDYGIGIVTLANRTYSGVGRVNVHVLDTLVKKARLEKRVLPPSKILEQRKNQLVALFPTWESAMESGLFAENFFADNPIDSLAKYTRQGYERAGKVSVAGPLKAENQLRGEFVLYGERADLNVYFTLSPETPALIQELRLKVVDK
jgi:CubicO group peptidase (beta-lactamase class C family)